MRGCFSPKALLRSASEVFPAYAGVFPPSTQLFTSATVFPAYAGVFPVMSLIHGQRIGLPRICGGVSGSTQGKSQNARSSPHMRGCFFTVQTATIWMAVFPAYAGVFLNWMRLSPEACGLPRICGGVSLLSAVRLVNLRSSPHMRGCFFIALAKIAIS